MGHHLRLCCKRFLAWQEIETAGRRRCAAPVSTERSPEKKARFAGSQYPVSLSNTQTYRAAKTYSRLIGETRKEKKSYRGEADSRTQCELGLCSSAILYIVGAMKPVCSFASETMPAFILSIGATAPANRGHVSGVGDDPTPRLRSANSRSISVLMSKFLWCLMARQQTA